MEPAVAVHGPHRMGLRMAYACLAPADPNKLELADQLAISCLIITVHELGCFSQVCQKYSLNWPLKAPSEDCVIQWNGL